MDPATNTISEKIDKSYLSAAVDSISPWSTSRSPVTKSSPNLDRSGLRNQYGGDRITQQFNGPNPKRYPPDCPPLFPRWFHATDIPKRKPNLLNTKPQPEPKSTPVPKKFEPFSEHDSRAIEAAYQQLVDEYHDAKKEKLNYNSGLHSSSNISKKTHIGQNDADLEDTTIGRVKVPVQEDYLFDVDVERREISPVYWLGPIYEVRRGSWFYQEGTILRPCEENLAAQLEEGYLKTKPFRYQMPPETQTNSPKSQIKNGDSLNSNPSSTCNRNQAGTSEVAPQMSSDDNRKQKHDSDGKSTVSSRELLANTIHQPQTYRLFGTYMNSVVTYQDAYVAWLSADSIISRMSSTVYQKFAGGGYLGGVKLVRGYTESSKPKEIPENKGYQSPSNLGQKSSESAENRSLRLDKAQHKILKKRLGQQDSPEIESRSFRDSPQNTDLSLFSDNNSEEYVVESNLSDEQTDSESGNNDREVESQGRQIDHLILCTHGIGQRLGMRTESVNFVHDVNVLRQTVKNVYESSADLQALNSEIDKPSKNCRIQVLPICWRHLLDFPQKGVRQTRKEHDLGDAFGDEEAYPSLEDITIEGVPFVRSLITDLALDILLFQSAYREHICNIVLAESNRTYNLFKERNPEFKGKVSLLGHSLGSAILFDLLSRQKEDFHDQGPRQKHKKRSTSSSNSQTSDQGFEFEVEDFYCYGSPIGLFQMLKGRNILARKSRKDFMTDESVNDPVNLQDSIFAANMVSKLSSAQNISSVTGLPPTVSSPKVGRLFNIFHPSDPIAYRLEPLISPAMSSMKPQSIPYTKKTISSSMSGIGAKVGQSVSGIWSSLSSGLASSLFNRSLGLTNDDIARMEASGSSRQSSQTIVSNKASGALLEGSTSRKEEISFKKKQHAQHTVTSDQEGTVRSVGATTLTDDNIETLYSGFQKARRTDHSTSEDNWKRIKGEEAKIRALNSNGRVDYSLQETFLDLNPMNTIASHMSYWADEDVSHFMMSQLLSHHRETSKQE